MGNLLPSYKKAIFDEIANSISTNTSQYYAFASNPKEYVGTVPQVTSDNYSSMFEYNWNMIFGKKLTINDIIPVIKRNIWTPGTVYDRYDSTSNTMYQNNNYYVITTPDQNGGNYYVYKCINNNNGLPSTVKPSTIGDPTQAANFITRPDNYEWKYITTIPTATFNKFSTPEYAPVNPSIPENTTFGTGVSLVVVANGGVGYSTYTNGTVKGVLGTNMIRLDNDASSDSGFYTNCSIYLYNTGTATSQLKTISNYTVNGGEKWVTVSEPIDTNLVDINSTLYSINPKVVFETDGLGTVSAVAVINTVSNSISNVLMLETGENVSWANVSIQSNFGSGAVVYAVIPPPGGHGSNPAVELNMKGYCVAFDFNNTEDGKIIASNINYNKIGVIKNPYALNETNGNKELTRYSSNTFSCLLKANVNHTFTKGETVIGGQSKARGTVVFANSSQVFMVGDKDFIDDELLANSTTNDVTSININTRGDIYTKDLTPLYVQNINNVTRQNNQSESFKIIIKL